MFQNLEFGIFFFGALLRPFSHFRFCCLSTQILFGFLVVEKRNAAAQTLVERLIFFCVLLVVPRFQFFDFDPFFDQFVDDRHHHMTM